MRLFFSLIMSEDNNQKNHVRFTIFGLHFSIDIKRWFSLTLRCWIGMLILLLFSTTVLEYEMTHADLPMGVVFGGLLGYFFHVILD